MLKGFEREVFFVTKNGISYKIENEVITINKYIYSLFILSFALLCFSLWTRISGSLVSIVAIILLSLFVGATIAKIFLLMREKETKRRSTKTRKARGDLISSRFLNIGYEKTGVFFFFLAENRAIR